MNCNFSTTTYLSVAITNFHCKLCPIFLTNMILNTFKSLFCLCFVLVVSHQYLDAQVDYDKYPKASSSYYIQDVYVYTNGQLGTSLTNIVLKDGFIQDIGPRVKQPSDAIALALDSMYVYPAFVDVLSHPISSEEKGDRPNVKFPGLPPDAIAGITPQLSVTEKLKTEKVSLDKIRANGFGVSQLAFDKGMLPGETMIALLADDKDNRVITQSSNQVLQFKGAGGVYPNTIIGVMAKFRDLYKNAENLNANSKAYTQNSNGVQLPSSSEAIEALVPLTQRNQTLYIRTKKKLNNFRAIQLQQELGFNGVLVDPVDIAGIEKDLKSAGLPIVFSTEMPKEVDKPERVQDSLYSQADLEKLDMEDKRYNAYVLRTSQVKRALDAGIPVGFASLGKGGKDLKKSISHMIENGLSEKSAVDALTMAPARMLGIDNLVGSIDKRKLASLMITDGPYFEEKSNIRTMIVGKEIHEYEVKEKSKSGGDAKVNPEGQWEFTLQSPNGDDSGEIIIKPAGDTYTVTVSQDSDPDDKETIEDVELEGSEMDFSFTISEGGFTAEVVISLNFISDTEVDGNVKYGDFGSFPLTGTKTSAPE